MDPISEKIVERTWQEMAQLEAEDVMEIVEEISREQPAVLAYLMGTGADIFDQDERELLLYIGMVVWRMMLQGDKPLKEVTDKCLDSTEEENFSMMEDLGQESPGDFIAVTENMLNNYNQLEVLRYVVEAIMEEDEEGSEIREESKGWMLVFLKTVIDCFDKV